MAIKTNPFYSPGFSTEEKKKRGQSFLNVHGNKAERELFEQYQPSANKSGDPTVYQGSAGGRSYSDFLLYGDKGFADFKTQKGFKEQRTDKQKADLKFDRAAYGFEKSMREYEKAYTPTATPEKSSEKPILLSDSNPRKQELMAEGYRTPNPYSGLAGITQTYNPTYSITPGMMLDAYLMQPKMDQVGPAYQFDSAEKTTTAGAPTQNRMPAYIPDKGMATGAMTRAASDVHNKRMTDAGRALVNRVSAMAYGMF